MDGKPPPRLWNLHLQKKPKLNCMSPVKPSGGQSEGVAKKRRLLLDVVSTEQGVQQHAVGTVLPDEVPEQCTFIGGAGKSGTLPATARPAAERQEPPWPLQNAEMPPPQPLVTIPNVPRKPELPFLSESLAATAPPAAPRQKPPPPHTAEQLPPPPMLTSNAQHEPGLSESLVAPPPPAITPNSPQEPELPSISNESLAATAPPVDASQEEPEPPHTAEQSPFTPSVTFPIAPHEPPERPSLSEFLPGQDTVNQDEDEEEDQPQSTEQPHRPTLFSNARHELQLSSVPEYLPGRETVQEGLLQQAADTVLAEQDTGLCIFIGGVPGTGKTATVRAVQRSLHRLLAASHPVKCIEINAMSLKQPSQFYTKLYKEIMGETVSASRAAILLGQLFSSKDHRRKRLPYTILLVDEVDQLVTRSQDIVYDIFDWPSKPQSRFIVFAIANTFDLPERVLKPKIQSRIGMNKLIFRPYDKHELSAIITSRLQHITTFSEDAVATCATKVASISGDARRALHLCSQATIIAEEEYGECRFEDAPDLKVETHHIEKAVKQMVESIEQLYIASLSLQEKLFLAAVVVLSRLRATQTFSFEDIMNRHRLLCAKLSIKPPSRESLSMVFTRLVEGGLALKASRVSKGHIQLKVSVDDVQFALHNDAVISTIKSDDNTSLMF